MSCRLVLAAPAFAALTLASCGAAERTQTKTTLQDETAATTPTAAGVPAAQAPIPPAQGPGEFPAQQHPDRANAMEAANDNTAKPAEGTTR